MFSAVDIMLIKVLMTLVKKTKNSKFVLNSTIF